MEIIKMALPKYYEMHKPFLEHLKDEKEHNLKEVKAYISQYFSLTKDDLAEMLPSGRQAVFVNRIGWARTYLKKAGLISSPSRAVYLITQEGKKVLQENPAVIDVNFLMRYESFKEFQGVLNKDKKDDQNSAKENSETPDVIFEDAFNKINKGLQDELFNEIMKLSPQAFEQMVLDLMAKMGYGTFENAARTTKRSNDEGIDGIIMEDKLGFDLIYIQAKMWNVDHTVGRPELQAFVGAIAGKGGKGLFVTTSKFSKQAEEYAAKQHIILIDGDKLTQYMIEYNFGVTEKKIFSIKAIDTDIFNDYIDE